MKYPKPWEAGSPAGNPGVASSRQSGGPHEGQIQLYTYVNRPNTPDHTRLVRTWLSVEEAERLRDELAHHIELLRSRSADELERQKREGVGVFNPRFMAEDDDCREAQDSTPSLGPFKT